MVKSDLTADRDIDLVTIDLDYEGFKKLAVNEMLNSHERIGFPSNYRQGLEEDIYVDIASKLPAFLSKNKRILDIGCGCGELAKYILSVAKKRQHSIVMSDSQEMLDLLTGSDDFVKVPGEFPYNIEEIKKQFGEQYDAILIYSVFQYIVPSGNYFAFLDAAFSLIAPGGKLLIGDIPSQSKRIRFFESEAGVEFHQAFMGTNDKPDIESMKRVKHPITDAVILSVLKRAHQYGFDAYLMPQDEKLPMANRRDDILVSRP